MKKFITSLALAALCAGSVIAKDIQKVTVTTTPQMHCAGCENRIKNFFRFEKGIKKIETSVENQLVTITFDADKTTEAAIIEAFGRIDYTASKVEQPQQPQQPQEQQ